MELMMGIRYIIVCVFLWLAPLALSGQPLSGPSARQRADAVRLVSGDGRVMFQTLAARLMRGDDTANVLPHLDSLLNQPKGDMFWFYPAAGFYFTCKGKLNEGRRAQFRQALKVYTPYRGDTENHFLMNYACRLLFAQEWPELTRDDYLNGKNSRENYGEAAEYLNHWIDETARQGLTEWDSPRYTYYYLTPLLLLSEFTTDWTLRQRFTMMTELLLADYAVNYLNGSYCGAHSRDGEGTATDPRSAESFSYAQYFFEDTLKWALPDLAFAARTRFQCPQIIRSIAHDRRIPFVLNETKRSRAKIRFSAERYTTIPKYTYMTQDYALGSIQGGLQEPIQQHSWSVTFSDPRRNNTIFALHPYFSSLEFATFFPEEPELNTASVVRTKSAYSSPDKWVGGSPYERIVQHKSTLIALYDIPAGTTHPHVDAFFPMTLDTVIQSPATSPDGGMSHGWVITRMGHSFVGFFPFGGKYEWTQEKICYRLRINALRTGYAVECASDREMTFDQFIKKLSALTPSFTQPDDPNAGLSFTNLHGDVIAIPPPSGMSVNGGDVASDTTVLFNGPHLMSKRGSGIVELRCNGKVRVLDFTTNRIREK